MHISHFKSVSHYLLTILLLTFIIASCGYYSRTKVYYVNTVNGNDSNSGTSLAQPFKSIQKAADLISRGDTCYIFKGNYPERIYINVSGSRNHPIIFKAIGDSVVTKGFTINADFIHIEGFEIKSTDPHNWKDGAGIHLRGKGCKIINNYIHNVYLEGIRLGDDLTSPATSHCLVKGNRIFRCGQAGIQICGQNNLIESNEISGTVQWAKSNPQNLDADGLRFFGSGHIIKNNYIHDILLDDPENSASPHIDCVQTWGPAENIIFDQNEFSVGEPDKNKQIAMITEVKSPVRNITFKNNLFRDTFRGINVYGSYVSGKPTPIVNVSLVNNTFVNLRDNAFELHDSPQSSVINNIFFNCTSIFYDSKTKSKGLIIDFNCYYNDNGKFVEGITPTSNDIWNADPQFINPYKRDFRLKNTSPLLVKGMCLEDVKNDFSSKYKVKAKGCAIGAFSN